MSEQDKKRESIPREVIAEDETQIRRIGCVDGLTIPSKVAGCNAVKAAKGVKGPIRLIKENNRYFLEIELPVEFTLQGRYLQVKKKEE